MKKRIPALFLVLTLLLGLCFTNVAATVTERPWAKTFDFPTDSERAACPTNERAPYLASWLKIDDNTRYDAYCADIKADYLPRGTYCSPANFFLDLSSLKKQYQTVTQDGISGYAGLQRLGGGEEYVSILSFWDIFCTDRTGNTITIRAERTYPAEKTSDDSFGHEGTGAHTIRPYNWQAGRWYRMLLRCGTSAETGNTTVEQWLKDLTTNKWFHACTYDTGVPDSCFIGSSAFFLENYLSEYAAEVRSMEISNIRIHTTSDHKWHDVSSTGRIMQQFGSGSWQAGADTNSFYMITTGVTGKGIGATAATLTIKNTETEDPFKDLAAETNTFTDVPAWCSGAVAWAVENSVTNGTSDTTFSPDQDCTHAQILTFLWRAAGEPEPRVQRPPYFIQLNGNEYYADAVRWAEDYDMVNVHFDPDAKCTRAQAMAYIWAAFDRLDAEKCAFTDVDVNADYAKAVNWAVENGITNGTSATTFSPGQVCSRGQIVTFLQRAYVPEARLK